MSRRFVDLSIYLENSPLPDPPPLASKITYQTHQDTIKEFVNLLPGTKAEDFPDGAAAAAEWVTLTTHNGTHLDAPYHFHSTMNKGERSISVRPANVVAVDEDAVIVPRTLSHVVYFVPDAAKAEAFYIQSPGFRCTDCFIGAGPRLVPADNQDHHSPFFIQTPPSMKGCEDFTFHLAGPTELMQAGT